MEDQALVDGLRRGDVAAFDRAYGTHHARVFSFLLRLSGRRDTAEDLAQETWLKLARAAPSLREDTRLAPLLFTIARNAFVSWRRWAMLDLSRLVMFGFDAAGLTSTAPDVLHDQREEIAILERALQGLPVTSREVLLLVGVEGFEQEEAATILGIQHPALRKRLSRARIELASAIESLERKRGAKLKERA